VNVWLGDLDANGTKLTGLRQFTVDDAEERPYAWTPDSKAVLFRSDRDGHERIYKQATDSSVAELMTPATAYPHRARISPDGQWLLYELLAPTSSLQERGLMRMPLAGGEPQVVFHEEEPFDVRCGTVPGTVCALIRQKQNGDSLSLFDPMTGIEKEAVKTHPDERCGGISPDGQHISFLVASNPSNRIRVVNLHGVTEKLITVAGAASLDDFIWDASGSGFFVTDVLNSTVTSRLLHVGLDGAVHVLMEQRYTGELWAIPSPDGLHIATFKSSPSSNVWAVENR
jgi:dipeptidyl aminopeptidase/acylaminoacyl peptidase